MTARESVGVAARHRFEEACEERGIVFAVKEQVGGIEWVCG